MIKINCLVCNKEKYIWPYEKKRKFCSYECYWLYMKGKPNEKKKRQVSKICPECNKIFEVPRCHSFIKFCSIKCWRTYQKRNSHPRNIKEWMSARNEVLKQSNHTCINCGEKIEELDVHHIVPLRIMPKDNNELLVSLCKPCHRKTHSLMKKYNIYNLIGKDDECDIVFERKLF